MYTVSTNGATFNVTTASPVQMPAVAAQVPPPGRYCVMGHTWTLQYQTTRVGNQNVDNTALNALIDSAEQAAAQAGATCARVEVQASFIWGTVNGNLNGANADFSRYDYIATHLAQHGIAMMPIILQYGGSRIQSTVGTNKAFTSAADYGTYAGTVTRWIVQHNTQMASQGLPQIATVETPERTEPERTGSWIPTPVPVLRPFLKRAMRPSSPWRRTSLRMVPDLPTAVGNIPTCSPTSRTFIPPVAGPEYAGTVFQSTISPGKWIPLSITVRPSRDNGRTIAERKQLQSANGDGTPKICLTESGFASDTGAWGKYPQVAARDMALAYGVALTDPQVACIVNASIWDGDDGGGSYSAIGLGNTSSGAFVADPRFAAFASYAL